MKFSPFATQRPQISTLRAFLLILGLATALAAVAFATSSTPARAAQVNQVVIRAEGKSGAEQMELHINGEAVADWIVDANAADYVYTPTETIDVESLEVHFVNDNGSDRDLNVDYVDIGGVLLESEGADTTSTGTYVDGAGCIEQASASATLHCNGTFSYAVPNSTTVENTPAVDQVSITVRALGSTGSERLQININGNELSTQTLTTSYQDLTFTWPADAPITSAEVEFLNDSGSSDVRVDYIEVAGVRYESEDVNTFSTGTYFGGSCSEGFGTGEWLHCDGSFMYAIAGAAVDLPLDPSPSGDPDAEDEPVEEQDLLGDSDEPTTDQEVVDEPGDEVLAPEDDSGVSDQETADSPDEVLVVVRALGTTGTERLRVEINGALIGTETLSTSFQNFTYAWPVDVEVERAQVAFVNDAASRDVRVDYVEIDGTRYESEDADTFGTGLFRNGSCGESFTSNEWLHCDGAFIYPVNGSPVVVPVESDLANEDDPSDDQPATDSDDSESPRVVVDPNARYSIAEVIDGTISAGDGSNPNEESPMGRHDAPLALNQGWNWAQGPSRNSVWGQLGSGGSQYAEFRCAVIPEAGHTPPVPFRINVREGAYYQFANGNWQTGFDVDLTGGNHGGYLGTAGTSNSNPFDSGSHGLIDWRREADGSYSAPWNPSALMMHFWAGQREAPVSGQTAEFLTSEVRLQQPDGQTVDLSQVNVLFQCGVDYYATTGGQGTQVPGPGIGKYHRATTEWQPSLWVTLPNNVPANSVSDFETWLQANTPPNVG